MFGSALSRVSSSVCHHQRVRRPSGPRATIRVVLRKERIRRKRRHAVGQKRLIGRAYRAVHRRVGLSGDLFDHAAAVFLELAAGMAADVPSGFPHAGRIHVLVGHAVLRQVSEERIGVPRRPAVAAVRMPGPPADAHAAPELRAMLPEHTRDLHQAGVARGIVGDADVPRAVVRANQRERVGLRPAGNTHLRQTRAEPPRVHDADQPCAHRTARERVLQRARRSRGSPRRQERWGSDRSDRSPACPRPSCRSCCG